MKDIRNRSRTAHADDLADEVYRGDAGTPLVFSSGKVILTGFKDPGSMEAFASRLRNCETIVDPEVRYGEEAGTSPARGILGRNIQASRRDWHGL